MRALRSFTVRASLPEPLAPLHELAMNLRWSWDQRTRDLFRWVDPDAWEVTGHDPVRLLGLARRDRLEALAADAAFMAFLRDVHADLRRHLEEPLWFQGRSSDLRLVAYFSPEFGIAEALPQYSGGLGVLAGDHLKAASELGVPLVGVGLLYRQGYFRQSLNTDGWQQERYPDLDPYAMAVQKVDGARITVDLAGRPLVVQVWRADVGRVRLYLLDSDCEENDAEGRLVTDRLYGGDPQEHRIRQEIVLGIGGVRALEAVGEDPQVFHTNEGHAGFLGLERIRRLVKDEGLSFSEAVEAVRAGTIFTTHTPVPAGIDRFRREVMERHFGRWADEVGIRFDELMALGHRPGDTADSPFNMAVMGLRLAGMSNGVSRLHGEVSRAMFHDLWPAVDVDEVPIGSITNGVHGPTWVSPEMDDLLTRAVRPSWSEAGPDDWARVADVRDDEMWRVKEQCRERLVAMVRERLRASVVAESGHGEAAWCDDVFDPHVLTIGFARRFASYKRATLLLSQPERLRELLLSVDRPVQLVFAGKAHPADDIGKEMIRQIVAFSRQPDIRNRFAFIPDYDIAVARALVQGCDVWLNVPRRPHEASGTSGEKAALNGSLNLSILDGWWAEMFDGDNGWAVSSSEAVDDLARRDELEAESLFDVLERQVVPLFYERVGDRVPHGWMRKVKSTLRSLGPQVSAARMVRDYTVEVYEPTAARADRLGSDGHARAREVATWKQRLAKAWGEVRVEAVDGGEPVASLGDEQRVQAVVHLGSLDPDDVAVQLVHGPVGSTDELTPPSVVTMHPVDAPARKRGGGGGGGEGRCYEARFRCFTAGRYGYAVRVVPAHPDITGFPETGLVTWA